MMTKASQAFSGFASLYGMLLVLLLLCVYFSWATWHEESPDGQAGAVLLAEQITRAAPKGSEVVVVASADSEGNDFAANLRDALIQAGYTVGAPVQGDPPTVRAALEGRGSSVHWVATTRTCQDWPLWDALKRASPAFASLQVIAPGTVRRSTFLTASNIRNIADQIAVIAIMAVGMTMVIITGGIDLSVGSLLALSAVLTAWLIQRAGGQNASSAVMIGSSLAAIGVCGIVGAFSGWLVAFFRVPPFIVTLAGMQIASGFAFIVAKGQSLYDIPASFTVLGRGEALLTIPNAVLLMALIYVLAHYGMAKTAYGRYIYAVGGNMEATRLSGVRVSRTLILVYIISALMAGIGGVITTSQLKAGAPTYGVMYEMYVIAAVVVGGTSLTGGQGRVFGTLIGAFIIAVIRNGMNLMDVEAYTQKVLLGLVILGAVLIDIFRQRRSRRV